MRRSNFSAILAVAALILVAGETANAADRAFKSTTDVIRTGGSVIDGLVYSGTANATHMGLAEVSVEVFLDLENGSAEGTVTLTDKAGDSIYIEFTQSLGADGFTYFGNFSIIGGTGKFEGATGSGTLVNTAGAVVGERIGMYEGTISY